MGNRGVGYFAPANPDAPYFAIKIQDRIFDIDINFIESLTFERKTDVNGNFSFTIVNAMELDLESSFMKLIATSGESGGQNISFQYGWNKGQKSKWYSGLIWNYTPTFMPGGFIKMDVQGYTIATGEDIIERVTSYTGNSASDIVQQICEDMGWIIEELEPSMPFDEPRTYRVSNIGTDAFIRDVLEPIAINSKKEPFKFYLDSYNAQDHVYFVSVNKTIGQQKNYNFFVNMGNYGSVLSWAPKYEGKWISSMVMESPTFDFDTNDLYVYGSSAKAAARDGASLTVYGSTSPDNMEALLANKWYHENIGNISASMEIVGDPTLMPLQKINVIPMDPNGVPHISAGTYMIRSITDTISGDFRSSLDLIQAGVENGSKTLNLSESVELKGSK